jgi:hypothetical protein
MASGLIAIKAENLIIEQEVSSVPVYRARYQGVTWPQGASGPTIAIGVDLGYCSHDEFERAWTGRISDEMIGILHQGIGLRGEAAGAAVHAGMFRGVDIPWEAAIAEFEQVEIPIWIEKVNAVFPNLDKLGPYCEGGMLSLGFNRGVAIQDPPGSDRRLEMRNIRADLISGNYDDIPKQIRSMKRLWNNGLVARREAEACLFEEGLVAFHAAE